MNEFYLVIAIVLLLTIVAGLIRIVRGPSAGDRMLAAQLFGTTGVATILLLAYSGLGPRLLDLALVIAALAAVVGVAFALRGWVESGASTKEENCDL